MKIKWIECHFDDDAIELPNRNITFIVILGISRNKNNIQAIFQELNIKTFPIQNKQKLNIGLAAYFYGNGKIVLLFVTKFHIFYRLVYANIQQKISIKINQLIYAIIFPTTVHKVPEQYFIRDRLNLYLLPKFISYQSLMAIQLIFNNYNQKTNRFYKPMQKTKPNQKEIRKPVNSNFAPKRLALCYDPPMIIIEYLVVNTGKLYHHKMRLSSILSKDQVSDQQILTYLKQKHSLYFVNGKIKDVQLLKLIAKLNKARKICQNENKQNSNKQVSTEYKNTPDDQEEYEEDFEYLDYSESERPESRTTVQIKQNLKNKSSSNQPEKAKKSPNSFLSSINRNQKEDKQQEENANWDLQLDDNFDFI